MSTSTSSTQTEQLEWAARPLLQPAGLESEAAGLKEFLQRVEGDMHKELLRNARSHAFDGFQVNWEDHNHGVSRSKLKYWNY